MEDPSNASPADSPLIWRDGQPRSRLFGDVYYSLEDGLAETRAVFLEGCGLPQAWAGRRRFTVAELGFGTGLNIAALLELWRRTRPSGGHLHIFSIEGFPLGRAEAARALCAWPEISAASEALLNQWPGARRGVHRLDLPEFAATLDLAVMDVEPALEGWAGKADAWFLDGFSPALNPQMWRDEVLALVGARSAPGAVAATFTVAGQVRRGLAAAGFEVAKAPGHGRKRERLEARIPGAATAPAPCPRIAIVGGGIAGASLARAFHALGVATQVFDGPASHAKASGNKAALVMPALDAGGGARSRFYAQAFGRAVQLYDQIPQAVLARGAAQAQAAPRDARRFDAVAGQDIFDAGTVRGLDADALSAVLAEPRGGVGLWFEEGRVVAPHHILDAWLSSPSAAQVLSIDRAEDGWRLALSEGGAAEFDAVILSNGWQVCTLAANLPITPVRGQASFCATPEALVAAAAGAYAIPAPDGVLFGATHDRGDADAGFRAEDDARNLAALKAFRPHLAARFAGETLSGRASVRGTTPDRMPMAGMVEPGLFVLCGLGSRGFATAPLLADHVAALATGAPSPLPRDLAAQVDPLRFGEK